MILVRLVYVSTVSEKFVPSDLEDILNIANRHNNINDVSGLLCFSNKYFLQCLEGSRSQVNKIYQKILKDERHKDIVILHYEEVADREFENWSMGYVPESSITAPIILKYSSTKTFNPYEMTGQGAFMLISALKRNIKS
jgi:hypothetical protein